MQMSVLNRLLENLTTIERVGWGVWAICVW
jgi:hypothetical protein